MLCCRYDGRRLNLSVPLRLSIGDGGNSHCCGHRGTPNSGDGGSTSSAGGSGGPISTCGHGGLRRRFGLGRRCFVLVRNRGRNTSYSNTSRRSRGYLANARLSRFERRVCSGLGRGGRFSSLCAATTATPATTAPATATVVAAAPRPALAGSADASALNRGHGRRSFVAGGGHSRRGRGSHHDRFNGDRCSFRRHDGGCCYSSHRRLPRGFTGWTAETGGFCRAVARFVSMRARK